MAYYGRSFWVFLLNIFKYPVLLCVCSFLLFTATAFIPENFIDIPILMRYTGVGVLTLAIILLAYNFFSVFLNYYEKKSYAKGLYFTALTLSVIKRGLGVVAALIFVSIIVSLPDLNANQKVYVHKFIYCLLIGYIGYIVLHIINRIESLYYDYSMDTSAQDRNTRRATYTRIHVIKNILNILVVIVTIASILMLFDYFRNIGISLLASAGFITAMAGFAAQNTLGAFFSGLQFAFAQPVKIGDKVIIEKELGTIEQISLTYLVLKTWDLRRLIIPISYFIQKPFQNWTINDTELVGEVFLYLDFSVPMTQLRAQFEKIVNESTLWNKNVKAVQVTEFKENCIVVRLLMSAADSSSLFDLRVFVREQLLDYLNKNFPHAFPRVRNQSVENLDNKES